MEPRVLNAAVQRRLDRVKIAGAASRNEDQLSLRWLTVPRTRHRQGRSPADELEQGALVRFVGCVDETLDTEQGRWEVLQQLLQRTGSNPDIQGVIDALDLSAHMEHSVPEVLDLTQESAATLAMYGIGKERTDDFGRQCLTARRLVEAGVRFVELANSGWDQHSGLDTVLPKRCQEVDQPIAALLADLQQRGLLDETLVFWGGEFGRQPETQVLSGKVALGRDHNAAGYTLWLAGGGIRGGLAYGATDEYGYEAVENPVHLHDLHATMLHLLGLDHLRLTFRYAGRDFRLTDVHGNVVHDLIG